MELANRNRLKPRLNRTDTLLGSLPKAGWLLADRGYDADWFREALKDKGIKVCIPGRKSRKKAVKYDKWVVRDV